ncbi:MAG: hypothetical protein ACLP9L_33080 [Thermoguttaceae bacterium]
MLNKVMMRSLLAVAVLVAAVLATAAARADTVNLVTGWNINWNIDANPSESPTQDIQIVNATSSSDQIFNGYDLGLVFQRISGSGQIALDTASNPLSNSIVPSWLGLPELGTGNNLFGAGNEVYIGNQASSATNYTVPNSPASLVTVAFTSGASTPTVGSVFEVFSDAGYSDYVDHSANSTSYANNDSNVLLGTITVMGGDPVPEPSLPVGLLGFVGAGFVIQCAGRKIRRRDSRVA